MIKHVKHSSHGFRGDTVLGFRRLFMLGMHNKYRAGKSSIVDSHHRRLWECILLCIIPII